MGVLLSTVFCRCGVGPSVPILDLGSKVKRICWTSIPGKSTSDISHTTLKRGRLGRSCIDKNSCTRGSKDFTHPAGILYYLATQLAERTNSWAPIFSFLTTAYLNRGKNINTCIQPTQHMHTREHSSLS